MSMREDDDRLLEELFSEFVRRLDQLEAQVARLEARVTAGNL